MRRQNAVRFLLLGGIVLAGSIDTGCQGNYDHKEQYDKVQQALSCAPGVLTHGCTYEQQNETCYFDGKPLVCANCIWWDQKALSQSGGKIPDNSKCQPSEAGVGGTSAGGAGGNQDASAGSGGTSVGGTGGTSTGGTGGTDQDAAAGSAGTSTGGTGGTQCYCTPGAKFGPCEGDGWQYCLTDCINLTACLHTGAGGSGGSSTGGAGGTSTGGTAGTGGTSTGGTAGTAGVAGSAGSSTGGTGGTSTGGSAGSAGTSTGGTAGAAGTGGTFGDCKGGQECATYSFPPNYSCKETLPQEPGSDAGLEVVTYGCVCGWVMSIDAIPYMICVNPPDGGTAGTGGTSTGGAGGTGGTSTGGTAGTAGVAGSAGSSTGGTGGTSTGGSGGTTTGGSAGAAGSATGGAGGTGGVSDAGVSVLKNPRLLDPVFNACQNSQIKTSSSTLSSVGLFLEIDDLSNVSYPGALFGEYDWTSSLVVGGSTSWGLRTVAPTPFDKTIFVQLSTNFTPYARQFMQKYVDPASLKQCELYHEDGYTCAGTKDATLAAHLWCPVRAIVWKNSVQLETFTDAADKVTAPTNIIQKQINKDSNDFYTVKYVTVITDAIAQ